MDLLGREIYSGKEREVDVRDWKNGVYFVRVNGIYCVRFVKM